MSEIFLVRFCRKFPFDHLIFCFIFSFDLLVFYAKISGGFSLRFQVTEWKLFTILRFEQKLSSECSNLYSTFHETNFWQMVRPHRQFETMNSIAIQCLSADSETQFLQKWKFRKTDRFSENRTQTVEHVFVAHFEIKKLVFIIDLKDRRPRLRWSSHHIYIDDFRWKIDEWWSNAITNSPISCATIS